MSLAREGKPVSRKWLLVAASTTLIVVLAGCGLITLGSSGKGNAVNLQPGPYWVENGIRLVVGSSVVVEDEEGIEDPIFAPDRLHVAYSHGNTLILGDLSRGTSKVLVESEPDFMPSAAAWSSDSKELLVVNSSTSGYVGGNELMIVNIASGRGSVVVQGVASADWAPDGRIVVALPGEMYITDEQGRNKEELTPEEGGAWISADHPVFMNDGENIVYQLGSEYYSHNIDSDTSRLLFSVDGDDDGAARCGNDGRVVIADQGTVYAYDPAKDEAEVVYDGATSTYPGWVK